MKTSLVTSGQKESVVRVVVDAVRKEIEGVIDDLVKTGTINTANLQRVLAQGNSLAKHVANAAKEKMIELAEQVVGHLKLISGGTEIVIVPTDGSRLIADADDVFPGYIDSDFVNYKTNIPGQPTKETPVQVFEMIKDGTFAQIFGGFGENLDRLCLSQYQIIRFVKDYEKWLRADGYGTFFLFKVGNEFFVAYVHRYDGGLEVDVRRLSLDYVWSAEFRLCIVVPQL